MQHGCLINAELVNCLWKNTVTTVNSTAQRRDYTKRVNKGLNFTKMRKKVQFVCTQPKVGPKGMENMGYVTE